MGLVESVPRDILRHTNVVLSVKFDTTRSLSRYSYFIQARLGSDVCYSPNCWTKADCRFLPNSKQQSRSTSPQDFPYCLGRREHCTRFYQGLEPTPGQAEDICWRASYRWHLARVRNGQDALMFQVVEDDELGEGQRVETEIARDLNIRIVQVHVSVATWGCTAMESAALLLACLFIFVFLRCRFAKLEVAERPFLLLYLSAYSISSYSVLAAAIALVRRHSMPKSLWRLPELLTMLTVVMDCFRAALTNQQCLEAGMLRSMRRYSLDLDPTDYHWYVLISMWLVLALGGGRALLDDGAHREIERELFRGGILAVDVADDAVYWPRHRFCQKFVLSLLVLASYYLSVKCYGFLWVLYAILSADPACFSCHNIFDLGYVVAQFVLRESPERCAIVDSVVLALSLCLGLLLLIAWLLLTGPIWRHLGLQQRWTSSLPDLGSNWLRLVLSFGRRCVSRRLSHDQAALSMQLVNNAAEGN
mmetsp:Transcript_102901/g.286585  ORF Transcript_102901/g.286585 Transcript_102901/m.286585 type:complete len:476 (+) Transcript_102901:70-1497(+)